jgi:hypothetical protein
MAVLAVVLTIPGPLKLKVTLPLVLPAVRVIVGFVQVIGPLAVRLRFWGDCVLPVTVTVVTAVQPVGAVAITV